jgi:uncharacterized OsmC-like protein
MLQAMVVDLIAPTELEVRELGRPAFVLSGDAGGEGFGALQMFAASLGACTGAVLVAYSENVLHVPVDGLRLRVRWRYAERPRRVGALELEVHWPELPEDRLDAVRRAAASCTVHRTLERAPDVETTVHRD